MRPQDPTGRRQHGASPAALDQRLAEHGEAFQAVARARLGEFETAVGAHRAGIEGRISVLMRGRGMKRCRAEGAERFALFVGAAVLANNLMKIAALLTERSSRRRKAA